MNYFTNHKIIKDHDQITLLLYLDPQLNEFAKEFIEKQAQGQEKQNLEKSIRDYIHQKLPNLKAKTIHIMLGSLLITSIPFSQLEATVKNPARAQTQTIYTIQSGDTLFKIANKFSTSVVQLKSINGLTSDLIYPGQQLKIPEQKTGTYTVRSGDTLYTIAKQYNISVNELKAMNGLTDNIIYPGQSLYIQNKENTNIAKELPNGVFKIGDRGEAIKKIQKGLNALGYALVEDGIYGLNTKNAILQFQKQYTILSNDGIYGPKTKTYLQKALLGNDIIASNPRDVLVLVNKNNSLPSDYIPENLIVPNVPFPFKEYSSKKLMRKDAASALEALFSKAKADGIDLYATSGYRSYSRQEAIFASNVHKYGEERANQFSARPGESEHQTGLAMDVTSSSVNFLLTQSFGATKEGKWLKENAPQFGFIIRYQKGKEHITGYQYEPWHIRYIGKDSAKEIAYKNITLEEYLGRP